MLTIKQTVTKDFEIKVPAREICEHIRSSPAVDVVQYLLACMGALTDWELQRTAEVLAMDFPQSEQHRDKFLAIADAMENCAGRIQQAMSDKPKPDTQAHP